MKSLGAILGVLGVVWAVHGAALGLILGVLGCPWAPLAANRLKKPPSSFRVAPF